MQHEVQSVAKVGRWGPAHSSSALLSLKVEVCTQVTSLPRPEGFWDMEFWELKPEESWANQDELVIPSMHSSTVTDYQDVLVSERI